MDIITLSHGSGGKCTNELIKNLFYKYFENPILMQQNDSSVIPQINGKIAVSTDSFVVNPIFFPGGDIGKLSICGTVNDLAMSGATPLYITVGFIIEEGLSIETLEKIVISMANTSKKAGVKIVAGDTKVVDKGSSDKIYINTTGIGVIEDDIYLSGENLKSNDKVIISGTIGDHGVTIMKNRNNLEFDFDIKSDCSLLNNLIKDILKVSKNVRVLRDPTRGGLATTLNELCSQSNKSMIIYEEEIPVKEEVLSICEILGMEPIYMANEGKLVVVVDENDVDKILEVMKNNPVGLDAKLIGEVIDDNKNNVYLKTNIGGTRIISMPEGQLLPRIC